METFDYIIVGGGTAGCILAERLTANGKYHVLVIEAGTPPRSPWIPIPAGFSKLLVNQQYNWRLTPRLNLQRPTALYLFLGGAASVARR